MGIVSDVTHSHLEIEHLLRELKAAFGRRRSEDAPGSSDPAAWIARFEILESVYKGHADHEEENLYPRAREQFGDDLPEVDTLEAQHEELNALLAKILETLRKGGEETDLDEIEALFGQFVSQFETHSQAEADFLDRTTTLLFPGGSIGG